MDNKTKIEEILREKAESWSVMPPESAWEKISGELDKRRSRIVFRRFAIGAAAAACLATLLVLNHPEPQSALVVPAPAVAQAENASAAEAPEMLEPKTMVEQIAALPSHMMAAAPEAVRSVAASEVPAGDAQPLEDAPEMAEEPSTTTSEAEVADASCDVREELDPKYSGLGYWDEEEYDSPSHEKRHTSLTISSNVAAKSSEDGFVYRVAPSYAPSLTGAGTSLGIEQVSEGNFSLPVKFGLMAEIPISNHLSVEAGISYMGLRGEFSALVDKQLFENCTSNVHYIGIPISVAYNIVNGSRLRVYVNAGGAADKCLQAKFGYDNGKSLDLDKSGIMFSANAGVGIEYRFGDHLGIYATPGAAYYFGEGQPFSICTQQPLQFNMGVGLRFHI